MPTAPAAAGVAGGAVGADGDVDTAGFAPETRVDVMVTVTGPPLIAFFWFFDDVVFGGTEDQSPGYRLKNPSYQSSGERRPANAEHSNARQATQKSRWFCVTRRTGVSQTGRPD